MNIFPMIVYLILLNMYENFRENQTLILPLIKIQSIDPPLYHHTFLQATLQTLVNFFFLYKSKFSIYINFIKLH